MCRLFLISLMIFAAVMLTGCEDRDLGTMPEQVDEEEAVPDRDVPSVRDPDISIHVDKWHVKREAIEYSVTAWGHSCATVRPKKKAEARAVEKAIDKIIELYNIEIASRVVTVPADALNRAEKVRHYGTRICEDDGFSFEGVGVWPGYEVERIDEKDGADCGKDVKVRLTGEACIYCYTP